MAQWHAASLSPEQYRSLRELENRLGLVLVAYSHEQAQHAGQPNHAERGRPEAVGGAPPDVLAALNEAYRSAGARIDPIH